MLSRHVELVESVAYEVLGGQLPLINDRLTCRTAPFARPKAAAKAKAAEAESVAKKHTEYTLTWE